MATVDKAISDLTAAAELLLNDLLVVEQGGQPKKMSGQVLMNYLLKNIDGHGGIQDVQHVSTVGLLNTYALIMADGEKLTFTVKDGEQGPTGQSDRLWMKWASTNPEEDANATLSDIPDSWVGIYTGILESAPTKASSYKWFKWQGPKGEVGLTPQLRIGTVTTTPYDEPASASISGSAENPVLNLRIPEGRPGVDGKYSSDMAENNAANPGYVRNRTHYVEDDGAYCFSADVEISSLDSYFSFSGVTEVGYGDMYNVKFNDTVYRCQSQDIVAVLGAHAPALGNLYLFSREFENTGEPFAFFITGSECTLRAPDYANQTVGLQVMKAEVVKTLDNKYLDAEWTATKMTTGVAGPILDYTIPFTSDNAIVNRIANAGLLNGGKYTVTWGGTVYECTGIADFDGAVYLGAPKLAGWQVEEGNPEAPFCIVSFGGAAALVYKTTATAENIAVKVVGHRETSLEKLPPEFLPDTLRMTSPNGTVFQLTVDDSGNLSAVKA